MNAFNVKENWYNNSTRSYTQKRPNSADTITQTMFEIPGAFKSALVKCHKTFEIYIEATGCISYKHVKTL